MNGNSNFMLHWCHDNATLLRQKGTKTKTKLRQKGKKTETKKEQKLKQD